MITKPLILLLALTSQLFSAEAKAKKPPVDFSPVVLDQSLWSTSVQDFKKDNTKFKFRWMSAQQSRLRSLGKSITTFGQPSGEILIVSNKAKNLSGISISFYNRGDNESISSALFHDRYKNVADQITTLTKSRPQESSTKSTVALTKTLWEYQGAAILLEKSFNKKSSQPEFIRLRVKSLKSSKQGVKTAKKASLKKNVSRAKNGDVLINDIPMVDQGRKGYCVCASAARIYQYYGRETDQHEIAQLAGSTASSGTQINEMVYSLKRVTGKLNSRVFILYEYPKGISSLPIQAKRDAGKAKYNDYNKIINGLDDLKNDVNNYQRLAKKQKGKSVRGGSSYSKYDRDYQFSFAEMRTFKSICDPKIYREVMMKKSSFKRANDKIRKNIDLGIPVAWTLNLGLFPEPEIPQADGGHMRLIIGYNDKTQKIIYTDSWGAGHEKKYMDMGEAFSMTSCLLSLPPSR